MAEFEEKLNAILGDSEAMGQIVSIARSLTGEGGAPEPGDAHEAEPTGEDTPDLSALLGALGGLGGGGDNPLSALGELDPRLLQIGMTLFSTYSATDDNKIALLTALKPFLKAERYAKVDKAVQIAKLSRVIRVAFQLFKKEGGEADV